MSSKRPPPSGPKPPVAFSSSITISDSAALTGSHLITISSETVIHPRTRLDSLSGPLNIGRRCIISERSLIGASPPSGRISQTGVTIGDYVVVEVGAIIEGGDTVIGDGSTIGVGARIGAGARVGKGVTVAARGEVRPGEEVEDGMVVWGRGNKKRKDERGVESLRNKGVQRQIEVLRRMVVSNPAKFQ